MIFGGRQLAHLTDPQHLTASRARSKAPVISREPVRFSLSGAYDKIKERDCARLLIREKTGPGISKGGPMRICDLRQKEVINTCDCKRLGFVSDVEFDCDTGKLTALIVPGEAKICGIFGRDTEYIIPFCKVCQIGPDIILVDIKEEEVLVQCKG